MSRYIDQHRGRFGVEPVCEALGVSASAYYLVEFLDTQPGDTDRATEIIERIPGAWERAREGRAQIDAGHGIPLDGSSRVGEQPGAESAGARGSRPHDRSYPLPADTRERLRDRLALVERFPHSGQDLSGRWAGHQRVLGPYRWLASTTSSTATR